MNLALFMWESTAIPSRLPIAFYLVILTMRHCKPDTQASKGWKNLRKCGTKNETLRPSGYVRAVARAMKTRATARAERKKPQPDSTHRGIFFNGADDGLNPRVRGPAQRWRHLVVTYRSSLFSMPAASRKT